MIGIVFGTVCLLVLVRLAVGSAMRRHAWAYGGGGCHGGPGAWRGGWHGGMHGGWRGGRRGPGMAPESMAKAAGEVLKRRLDIDEEQEGIVDHALIDLRTAFKELTSELADTRQGLAEAFQGETVDEAAIAGAFARHDDALARARRQAVSALKQIHAVLRPEQRKRAVEWATKTSPRWV